MPISFPRTVRYVRTWLTGRDDLLEDEVHLDREGTSVPATLLRRRDTVEPLPAWIVMHGITRPGRRHKQLVRFSRAIASTGTAVIVPEVPEWVDLDLSPALTVPTIESAIAALRDIPGVRQGPYGLVGFSFGAPHTIVAAGDPRLIDDVAGVVGFGGYCDLERTIRFMLTGRHEHGGEEFATRPDPYGRWIVAANYLTEIEGYEQAGDVADGCRRLAALAGDTGAPAWDPQYDPAKLQLREQIDESRRPLFDLIASPSTKDPEQGPAEELAEKLASAGRRVQPEMEPGPALGDVRCPVHVIHGRYDHLILFSEGLRLREALPSDSELYATVTRLFGHSAQDPWPSPMQALHEVPLLLRALGRVFAVV